jgi:hypothetical protein
MVYSERTAKRIFSCCAGDRSVMKGFFRTSKWGIGPYRWTDHFWEGAKCKQKAIPKVSAKKPMIRYLHTKRSTEVDCSEVANIAESMHPESHMDSRKDDCGDNRRNEKYFCVYFAHF